MCKRYYWPINYFDGSWFTDKLLKNLKLRFLSTIFKVFDTFSNILEFQWILKAMRYMIWFLLIHWNNLMAVPQLHEDSKKSAIQNLSVKWTCSINSLFTFCTEEISEWIHLLFGWNDPHWTIEHISLSTLSFLHLKPLWLRFNPIIDPEFHVQIRYLYIQKAKWEKLELMPCIPQECRNWTAKVFSFHIHQGNVIISFIRFTESILNYLFSIQNPKRRILWRIIDAHIRISK